MDPDFIKSLRWPDDRERLKDIQEELKKKIRIIPLEEPPSTVAGIDAAFSGDNIICVASLFSFPSLENIEDSIIVRKVAFPYIPGYLSFREGPAVIDAVNGLSTKPGLLIFDGQGTAHPRGVGIAAFMGALMDMPAIGCAKTRLVGEYVEPGRRRGERSELGHKGIAVGAVLRTQEGVKPVFVSPGHRINIEDSVKMVLACSPRYRLPDPIRRADALSKKMKRELG